MMMRMLAAGAVLASLTLTASAQPADLAAAKAEGKVVWYTSTPVETANKIAKLFEAQTGIRVELFRSGGSAILRRHGYPEHVIYAICSHADYLPDYPRVNLLDKALYACDELTGMIFAAAMVRPGGVTDLTAASVKKKMKSKGFARNVNREDITRGAADFGVELGEHIQFIIEALKPLAAELGIEKGMGSPEA